MATQNLRAVFLHLRLLFSLLLLPVFLFALAETPSVNNFNGLLVFIVLHLFIYPASNAYNSYFDKDEGSIALLERPPEITKALFFTAITLEWLGVLLALLVSVEFAAAMVIYSSFSKAYSHPYIRIKKYPVWSFLVVFIFQGFFIYYTCYHALGNIPLAISREVFTAGLLCSCFIGASYPLTQIYQHQEDRQRGDQTLSLLLGIRGSFIFSALVFAAAFVLMYSYWLLKDSLSNFYVFAACAAPLVIYFAWWFCRCVRNPEEASFKNTMRMTLLSGSLMLGYFGWLCCFA